MPAEHILESLGVYRGMPLELTLGGQDADARYVAKVMDMEEDEISVHFEAEEQKPEIKLRSTVNLRGVSAGANVFVLTGTVYEVMSDSVLRVGQLRMQANANRRDSFRQKIHSTADVTFIRGSNASKHIRPPKCQVMDVSVGGVRIRTKSDFQVDDEILLSDFRISSPERYNLKCSIQWKKEGITGNTYGCQFYGLTTRMEDQLHREVMLAEVDEIRRRRENEDF